MKQIVYNALRTPDGCTLVSRTTHDYKTHRDANQKVYMIDGGRDYVRSSAHGDEVYLTLYTDDSHSKIREVFTWGSYGITGDKPLTLIYLKDLTCTHIQAILQTQSHLPEYMRDLFKNEQEFRNG